MSIFKPKVNPAGHFPGKGSIDELGINGLRVGIITRVDELNMKADVRVMTGGGERVELDLTQGMAGPRSFWGGVPEVNSLVIIGYRPKSHQIREAVILGYIPVGSKSGLRFDPFAPSDPSDVDPADQQLYDDVIGPTVRMKRLKLSPGDVGGMSSSGAELVLAKDIRMTNRAGDLFEIRDTDRTLVSQATHSFAATAGVKVQSGPIRRGNLFLPPDIFKSNEDGTPLLQADGTPVTPQTLRDESTGYYGADDLKLAGPGLPGDPAKFIQGNGQPISFVNNTKDFPPVCYNNGQRYYYAATQPGVNFEDGEASGGALVFTEHRMEMAHLTDCTQQVLQEIDGFQMDRPRAYIEQVYGTVIGNDPYSSMGMRQYMRLLRPKVFDAWEQPARGKFTLETIPRSPIESDAEADAMAGAYLFKINPPVSNAEDNPFAVSVSKQGKLHVQVPGSNVERYPQAKNISAEVNLQGALKMFVGAETSSRTSINLTCEGGIVADIGRNVSGQAIQVTYHCSKSETIDGSQDDLGAASSLDIKGNKLLAVQGDDSTNIEGSKTTVVSGLYSMQSDTMGLNAFSGFSLTAGSYNRFITGKSIIAHALAIIEVIVAGGRITTVLAGALVTNVLAGAITMSTGAGAMTFTVGAAYAMSAGGAATLNAAAAMTLTAGAAMSINAAAAITMTAGAVMTLVSPAIVSLVAPQILLGGPPAVLGVCRGIPMYPPGAPSLDWITGQPLQGCSVVRSL